MERGVCMIHTYAYTPRHTVTYLASYGRVQEYEHGWANVYSHEGAHALGTHSSGRHRHMPWYIYIHMRRCICVYLGRGICMQREAWLLVYVHIHIPNVYGCLVALVYTHFKYTLYGGVEDLGVRTYICISIRSHFGGSCGWAGAP